MNIIQIVREIQSEDQHASSDEAVKEQHEQKALSEAAEDQQESKRGGVRATVSNSMKGNKLERKSSTKTLRRCPSTLSQTRKPWRNRAVVLAEHRALSYSKSPAYS